MSDIDTETPKDMSPEQQEVYDAIQTIAMGQDPLLFVHASAMYSFSNVVNAINNDDMTAEDAAVLMSKIFSNYLNINVQHTEKVAEIEAIADQLAEVSKKYKNVPGMILH